MRCVLCQDFSFWVICKSCQSDFLKPHFYRRELTPGFEVYSFYKYSNIRNLIAAKYTPVGRAIYRIMARNAFKVFAESLKYDSPLTVIPIDDKVGKGFSHTAVLASYLGQFPFKVKYGTLHAQNNASYSGKSYRFRIENPRNFKYRGTENIDAILVDDVVTTGLTLLEARESLIRQDVNVLFALTLSDAREEENVQGETT